MDETKLIAAVRGGEASAVDVALATGWDLEETELALARLMVDTGGSYHVLGEGEGQRVVYWFPPGFETRARRRRFRDDIVRPALESAAAIGRMTCGAAILVSLTIVAVVAVAVAVAWLVAHSNSGGRRRTVLPLNEGIRTWNQISLFYWCMGGQNPFFRPIYPRVPFWWWARAARDVRRGLARRERWARPWNSDADVEEEVRQPLVGDPAEPQQQQPKSAVRVLHAFLFGSDEEEEDERLQAKGWQMLGAAIRRAGCVLPPELLSPYLPEPPATTKGLDAAAARAACFFKAKPVPVPDAGGVVLEFHALRHASSFEIDLPPSLVEAPRDFGVTMNEAFACSAAGVANLVGISAIYFALAHGFDFEGLLPPASRAARRALALVVKLLLVYAVLFCILPALRYAALVVANARLAARNDTRSSLRQHVDAQLQIPDSALSRKARFARRRAALLLDDRS